MEFESMPLAPQASVQPGRTPGTVTTIGFEPIRSESKSDMLPITSHGNKKARVKGIEPLPTGLEAVVLTITPHKRIKRK